MEPYYYSQMNKTEQSAYHAMKTGLTALAPSFAVPRLENRELADIFFKLRLEYLCASPLMNFHDMLVPEQVDGVPYGGPADAVDLHQFIFRRKKGIRRIF